MLPQPLEIRLLQIASSATGLLLQWWVQSTVVIGVGLAVAFWLRGKGPALQSAIYRATLVVAMVCPLVGAILSTVGIAIPSVALPTVRVAAIEDVFVKVPAPPVVKPVLVAPSAIKDEPHSEVAASASPPPSIRDFPPFGDRQNSPLDMRSRFGDTAPATPSPPPIAKAAPATAPPAAKPAPPARMILVKRSAWAVHALPAIVVTVVTLAWIFGTLLLLTRLAIDLVRLVRLRRSATPASKEQQRVCREVAAQMNVRIPRLMHSPFVSGPCLAGVRTPAILLPEESLELPLAAVFVHELAHLRRGDCRWNLIRQASLALLYWQPLAWRLSRRMEEVAEEVCDDHVMHWGGDPITYASGLVRLAEQRTLPISTVVPLVTFRSLLGQRVHRILDHSRRLSLRAGVKALCAITVAGLMITLLVGPFGSNRQTFSSQLNDVAKVDAKKAVAEKPKKKISGEAKSSVVANAADVITKHVRGIVLLPNGKAANSAHVLLIGRVQQASRNLDFFNDLPKCIGSGVCDATGHFEISAPELSSVRYIDVQLLARSGDSAVAWRAINADSPDGDCRITLSNAVPVRGRLATLEGTPVAGMHVNVSGIVRKNSPTDSPEDWVYTFGGTLPTDIWPSGIDSDADGWFSVPGVAADLEIRLHFDQEPYAPEWYSLDPTADASKRIHTLAPAQIIKGIVVASDTGKPVGGATIHVNQGWEPGSHGMMGVEGKSDAQGRFRINPYAAKSYDVTAFGIAGTPYLAKIINLHWGNTEREHEMRIELPRGVLVSGRITDAVSGVRIQGAAVRYTPRDNNPFVTEDIPLRGIYQPTEISDKLGRFSIAVPAGPGHLTVKATSDYIIEQLDESQLILGKPGGAAVQVNADASLDPARGARNYTVNFRLIRGVTVAGKIVRNDGALPERVIMQHDGTTLFGDRFRPDCALTLAGSRFEIHGVPPAGEMPVYLLDPDAKQGKLFFARGRDAGKPMVVRLEPCGSLALRYLRAGGKPLVGKKPTLMISFEPGKVRERWHQMNGNEAAEATFIDGFDRVNCWDRSTDSDGRVVFPSLIPGVIYGLQRSNTNSQYFKDTVFDEIVVRPGERKALPEIVVDNRDELRYAEENRIKKEKERSKARMQTGPVTPLNVNRMSAVPVATAAASAAASKPAATTSSVDASLQIRGQVIDPSGKPAAGAKIFISGWLAGSGPGGQLRQFGVADAEGRFDFTVKQSDLSGGRTNGGLDSHLVAVVDGFGPAIGDLLDFDTAGTAKKLLAGDLDNLFIEQQFLKAYLAEKPRVLRLASDDVPLGGRIVSLEGQPIAGARVAVYAMEYSPTGNLDEWEKQARQKHDHSTTGRDGNTFSGYFSTFTPVAERQAVELLTPTTQFSTAISPATTDRDGRFTMRGIGRERLVELLVSGPGIETRTIWARTRNDETTAGDYANHFTDAAAPSNAVVGRLTDLDSGKPLAGFTVLPFKMHGKPYGEGQDYLRTTTDADGRYRLEGLPLGADNQIAVYTTSQPYLPKSATVNVDVASKPATHDFHLLRGAWAEGRVIDKATGQPIVGAVKYHAFMSNPFYKKTGQVGAVAMLGSDTICRVAADGHFQIAALPGRGILSFQAEDFRKYAVQGLGAEKIAGAKPMFGTMVFSTDPFCAVDQGTALVEVNPPATADSIHVDFEIDPGTTVVGRAVDSQGKPVTGAVYCGNEPGFDLWRGTKDDTFEVHGYDSKKPRRLVFYERGRNLAATYILKGVPATPLVVRLEPAASLRGRLTNAHGEPLRDAVLTTRITSNQQRMSDSVDALPLPLPPANPRVFGAAVPADHNGRFELHGLLPNRDYHLEVYNRTGQRNLGQLPDPVSAAADKTTDIGDVTPVQVRANDSAGDKQTVAGTAAIAPNPLQADSDADELHRVRGRVVDPQGNPVAGAEVSIVETYSPDSSTAIYRKVVTTKSDAAGRFDLAFRKSQFKSAARDYWRDSDIVALSPNVKLCLDWRRYDTIKPDEEITFRLRADEPVAGQIVDLQGRPVAGASVNADQWSSVTDVGAETVFGSRWKAITGSDGRFELSGLGRGREFQALVTGPGIVINRFQIVTAPKEEAKKLGLVPDDKNPYSRFQKRFYGSGFRVVVQPSQAIEGTVRDAKTGASLAHVLIAATHFAGWTGGQAMWAQTFSDGQGHYRLDGMPNGKGNRVRIVPPPAGPYFARELALPTAPDFAPIKFDIRLDRGIPIRGRLTDKVTGQPIAATAILYFPWPNNPNIQGIPEFHHGATPDLGDRQTDQDGRFMVVGLPGHGLLEVVGPPRPFPMGQGFREIAEMPSELEFMGVAGNFAAPSKDVTVAVKELQIGAAATDATADIKLDPGKSITLHIVDPAGKPLSGVHVVGRSLEDPWHHFGPTVEVQAPRPNEDRLLLLHAESRNLGKAVRVNWKKDGSGPLTVKLEPCGRLKARLLDKRGNPIPFGLIEFYAAWPDIFQPECQTDAQGRIDYAGILPGAQFMVTEAKDRSSLPYIVIDHLSVLPGETVDVGEFDVTSEKNRPKPIRTGAAGGTAPGAVPKHAALPVDTKLRAHSIAAPAGVAPRSPLKISGQVVGPDGKPVAGAKLFTVGWREGALPAREMKSWATTGADGRFEFEIGLERPLVYSALVASADGYGVAEGWLPDFDQSGRARKQFDADQLPRWTPQTPQPPVLHMTADDVPIKGRIIDLQGQPISGVRLSVMEVRYNRHENLDNWEKAARQPGSGLWSGRLREMFNGQQTPAVFPTATTDGDGRFTIGGIGRERLAKLMVHGPMVETQLVWTRTRRGEKITWKPQEHETDIDRPDDAVYGSDFTFMVGPSRPLTGTVTDADTGKPIPGVWIGAGETNTFTMGGKPWVDCVSNSSGHYMLEGLVEGRREELNILPPAESLYVPIGAVYTVKLKGPAPHRDFKLRRGVPVRGQVIDERTGKPVSGAVQYFAYDNNPNLAKAFSDFWRLRSFYERRTDSEGRFTIAVPAGRGILNFWADDNEHYLRGRGAETLTGPVENGIYRTEPSGFIPENGNVAQEIDLPIGSPPVEIKLALRSGVDVDGRIVDPEGKPAAAIFSGRKDPYELWSYGPSDSFKVLSYEPTRPRRLMFFESKRNLAALYMLSGEPPKPFLVRLQPAGTVRGRLIDDRGRPISNGDIAERIPPADFFSINTPTKTDDDGHFELRGLLPGQEYWLMVTRHQKPFTIYGYTTKSFSARGGETKDVGNIVASTEQPKKPAKVEKPIAALPASANFPKLADDDLIRVRGRVIDPQMKPVADSEVSVVQTYWELNRISRRIATTRSDSAGHFELKYRKSQFAPYGAEPWQSATIVAMPRDSSLGPAFCNSRSIKPPDDVTLQLVADEPIEGRLVDLEGKPVVGAEVRVTSLSAIKDNDLTAWLDAMKKGVPERSIPNYENLFRSLDTDFAGNWQMTTDAAGRFRFTGLGHERFTSIHVAAAGFVPLKLHVATRQFRPVKVDHTVLGGPANVVVEYGSQFQIALEPSQPVEGVVRDATSNQPIAGAKIIYKHFRPSYDASAVSDSNGRYRLEGMPKAADNETTVIPAQGQPYFVRRLKLPAVPGYEPVKFDFVLNRGALIHGRVTDKASGKPIVGAWMDYVPWPKNPKIRDTLEAARDHMYAPQNRCLTDRDGRFTLVGIAGRGLVEILRIETPYPAGQGFRDIADMPTELEFVQEYCGIAPSPRYPVAVKEVRPDDSLAAVEADFQLDPGHTLTLNVVDPAGAPISGLFANIGPPAHRVETENVGPSVAIRALGNDEDRLVFIYQKQRTLGKAARVCWKTDGPGPLTVRLEPCATLKARALDQHGLPIRGGMVKFYAERGDFAKDLPDGATDLDGRLNYTSLLPGGTYRVLISCRQLGFVPDLLVDNLSPSPGEVIDLGEFDVTSEKNRPKPIRATISADAASNAASANMPATQAASVVHAPDDLVHIHGRVVDSRGNAVSAADVSILVDGIGPVRALIRVASVKSDAKGRFDLQVPKTRFAAWGKDCWSSSTIIASSADGSLGIDWRSYSSVKPDEDIEFKLVADVPIDGHLTDLEGKPLAGARVSVGSICTNAANDLTAWLARIKRGVPEMRQHTFDGLDKCQWSGLSLYWDAKTDSQGRFRFSGIGRDRIAGLKISAPGHVPVIINVVTKPIEPVTAKSTQTHELRPDGDDVFYGSHLRFAMEPSQPIEGIVRDGKIGTPLPNVRIVADTFAGTAINTVTGLETTSDNRGHYRLDGMPKGKGNTVVAIPPDGQPYFMRDFEIPTTAGFQPVKFDLDLRRGVPIHGRLTDKLTGAPIEGASVIYVPWPNNPAIRKLPEFNRYYMPGTIQQDRYQTDRDGRFTQVGFPGRGLLEVYNPPRPYPTGQGFHAIKDLPPYNEFMKVAGAVAPGPQSTTAIKEVRIGDGQESITADIQLDSTKPVTLNIVDPAGKPLSGVQCSKTTDRDGYGSDVGPAVDIQALAPGEKRYLILFQSARNLGKAISVSLEQGAASPLTVKLEPCGTVKARLLDHFGKPLRHAAIYASVERFRLPNGTTDDNGRMTYISLLPGVPCRLTCDDLQVGKECTIAQNLTVEVGETVDLGEFDVTSKTDRPKMARNTAMAPR